MPDAPAELAEERTNRIAAEIEQFLNTEAAYLDPHLKLEQVVERCSFSRKYVIKVFIDRFGGFADYVNGLRIAYFERYRACERLAYRLFRTLQGTASEFYGRSCRRSQRIHLAEGLRESQGKIKISIKNNPRRCGGDSFFLLRIALCGVLIHGDGDPELLHLIEVVDGVLHILRDRTLREGLEIEQTGIAPPL